MSALLEFIFKVHEHSSGMEWNTKNIILLANLPWCWIIGTFRRTHLQRPQPMNSKLQVYYLMAGTHLSTAAFALTFDVRSS
jgi:hypothetical protein